jgi:hypothetical protein
MKGDMKIRPWAPELKRYGLREILVSVHNQDDLKLTEEQITVQPKHPE